MSTKDTQKIRQKSADELKKDAQKLRGDIAKAYIDAAMAPKKSTHIIGKMKRELAVTLTVLTEKLNS